MIKFPFFNVQELNLDWIMAMLKKILSFMPIDSGVAGDVLQRGTDGAEWMPISAVSLDIHGLTSASGLDSADEFAIYDNSAQGNYKVTLADILAEVPASAVTSVNGQTGTVVLDASDVSALPDTTTIPTDTSDLTNNAGFVDAAGAAAAAPVQSVNGQTGAVVIGKSSVGLGNVDNVQQYSVSNPPPYPVTSVNGQTGDVVVSGGGSAPTLLWSKIYPLNALNPTTLSLNLSDYDFIIMEYAVDSSVGCIKTEIFHVPTYPPPEGYSSYNSIDGVYTSGANGILASRSMNITTSGIVFGAGVRFDAYNNSNTVDNSLCRPLRIWGI